MMPYILQKMNAGLSTPVNLTPFPFDLIVSFPSLSAAFWFLHPSLCLSPNAIMEIHGLFCWKKNTLNRCFFFFLILPHCFRSHRCSSGPSTVGYLRYNTVLQPSTFNIRNMLMFATLVVSFFLSNLHFNSWGATCSFWRDNACQAHGNNTEWGTLPLLAFRWLSE